MKKGNACVCVVCVHTRLCVSSREYFEGSPLLFSAWMTIAPLAAECLGVPRVFLDFVHCVLDGGCVKVPASDL